MVLLLLVLIGVALFFIMIYNQIVKKNTLAVEAWSGIDVELKRRYDLIPSLVETVKGYAKHEKSTLEEIVKLRNSSQNTTSVDEKSKIESQISGAIRTIFALAESYPELKSSENFIHLHKSLEEIESNLLMARKYYNATVREYNTFITMFPINFVAEKFKFIQKQFFSIENDQERNNVEVKLS